MTIAMLRKILRCKLPMSLDAIIRVIRVAICFDAFELLHISCFVFSNPIHVNFYFYSHTFKSRGRDFFKGGGNVRAPAPT